MEWELTNEQIHHMALSLVEAEATFTDAVEWVARVQAKKLVEWIEKGCPHGDRDWSVVSGVCEACWRELKAKLEVK